MKMSSFIGPAKICLHSHPRMLREFPGKHWSLWWIIPYPLKGITLTQCSRSLPILATRCWSMQGFSSVMLLGVLHGRDPWPVVFLLVESPLDSPQQTAVVHTNIHVCGDCIHEYIEVATSGNEAVICIFHSTETFSFIITASFSDLADIVGQAVTTSLYTYATVICCFIQKLFQLQCLSLQ